MIRDIYRIKATDECFRLTLTLREQQSEPVQTDDEPVSFLIYDKPLKGDEVISTGAADATLEELVGLCDHDAESVNAHDFCGSHRVLGGLLYRQTGRETATKLMREIALRGGLHGMNGVCTDNDAYEEFGVGENGKDWFGTYGE